MEFEFEFDPHCEYLGMSRKQWEMLHGMKVKITATPLAPEPEEEEVGMHDRWLE